MIMQIRKPVLKFLSQKAKMFVDNTRLETNAIKYQTKFTY